MNEKNQLLEKENVNDIVNDINKQVSDSHDSDIPIEEGRIINLSNPYSISGEELDNIINSMKDLNIIEAYKAVSELNYELKNLESSKVFAEQIKSMEKSGELKGLAQQIATANVDTSEDTMIDDVDTFLNQYDELHEKLTSISTAAANRLQEFEDIDKTTTYMNDAMLSIIDRKIETIKKRNIAPNHPVSIYYKTLKDIYTNRNKVDYLLDKIMNIRVHISRTKARIKKDKTGQVRRSVGETISNNLKQIFSSDEIGATQLMTFMEYITELFNDSNAVYYLTYALSLIYSNSKNYKKTGDFKCVEVVILNVLDIAADMYDLEGGKEAFNEELLKLKSVINDIK